MSTQEKIEMMIRYAETFLGGKTPYLWGGKNFKGYDCSGFVSEILACAGLDPSGDQNAQNIYDYFSKKGWKEQLSRGSLLFFGKNKKGITHVAMAISHTFMVEAGGGDHHTISEEAAYQANAFVRIRTIDHRKDLVSTLFPGEEL